MYFGNTDGFVLDSGEMTTQMPAMTEDSLISHLKTCLVNVTQEIAREVKDTLESKRENIFSLNNAH